eukprot:UN14852
MKPRDVVIKFNQKIENIGFTEGFLKKVKAKILKLREEYRFFDIVLAERLGKIPTDLQRTITNASLQIFVILSKDIFQNNNG